MKTYIVTTHVVTSVAEGRSAVFDEPSFEHQIEAEAGDHAGSSLILQAALGRARRHLGWNIEADSGSVKVSWRLA